MTLVDPSVRVGHVRGTDLAAELTDLLQDVGVLLHPWVLGELVLAGPGGQRNAVVADLQRLAVAHASLTTRSSR